jgi:hypothetical protein
MKKVCGEEHCPMCEAGIIGRNHTKAITMGTPGALEAAVAYFCMTPAAVMYHCNTHEIKVDEEAGIYESNDFYMDRILKLMKRMDEWFKYLEAHATDRESITLGLRLVREMRETTKSLGEFQGRLNANKNPIVQIETLNLQYNQLTNLIMTEVCDECRDKIILLLNSQKKEMTSNFSASSDRPLLKECSRF